MCFWPSVLDIEHAAFSSDLIKPLSLIPDLNWQLQELQLLQLDATIISQKLSLESAMEDALCVAETSICMRVLAVRPADGAMSACRRSLCER